MPTINLLYKREYKINDHIKIVIPTVGEVIEKEDDYYGLVSLLTAMPIDLMVPLDDAGIDFSTINEYDLFLLLFREIRMRDTSLIFGDLDLTKFELAMEEKSQQTVLIDRENDIVIDRGIHSIIADVLRRLHHIERNMRKPGNEAAREYLLKRAREKAKRKKRSTFSQMEQLIVAMVNTEQYKYDYERTKELSIYQFNECVKQIINKIDYEHRMHGVYAGTIDSKSLSQDDLNWLVHK